MTTFLLCTCNPLNSKFTLADAVPGAPVEGSDCPPSSHGWVLIGRSARAHLAEASSLSWGQFYPAQPRPAIMSPAVTISVVM